MTCVVGVTDPTGTITMGSDSACTSDDLVLLLAEGKLSRKPEMIIGCCGAVRAIQCIRYRFTPPPLTGDVAAYMATLFIDDLRACHKAAGFAQTENNQEGTLSGLLVGVAGRLFKIDGDYGIVESRDGFAAVGSGAVAALGSLFATDGQSALTRVHTALAAAERFTSGVAGPFWTEVLGATQPLRVPDGSAWLK